MGIGVNGDPVGDPPSELDQFMLAFEKTGYLIFWVGFLKTVAGRRTSNLHDSPTTRGTGGRSRLTPPLTPVKQ